jgi:hypothetical protein
MDRTERTLLYRIEVILEQLGHPTPRWRQIRAAIDAIREERDPDPEWESEAIGTWAGELLEDILGDDRPVA